MKWTLMAKFIVTVVAVVIIVMLINIVAIFSFVIYRNTVYSSVLEEKLESLEAEDYTRSFSDYLVAQEENIVIDRDGQASLDKNDIWIQILDEQNKEIYNYKKPEGIKERYTPFELVQQYKYADEKTLTTIFIGEKQIEGRHYSYIIGFPRATIQRQVITINNHNFIDTMGKLIYSILLLDALIALVIAYLFSRRMTRPLNKIINGVLVLAEGKYDVKLSEKGIYTGVYRNLNHLASTLQNNAIERKELDQMREEWISNISHDIKTPLVSIKGYAEILSSDQYELSKDEINEYSAIIESKSNYIKELVDDLNLTTRLKNKVLTLKKKKVNIVSLVRSAVIDILNDSKGGKVDIEFICADEIIELFVDDILITRSIKNLLYNAIVHNQDGIHIEVKIEKQDHVRIVISDNGKGIKLEEQKHIFKRYYRGTNTGKGHKGSGLGMAIANDIVKAHDGEIKMRSDIGSGTEIEVYL